MPLTLKRLASILASFPRLTIGVIGDLFLDRYLELAPGATELSIETGLEAYQIERVRNSPGALGTVMNNLAALGVGCLRPVTVVGDDGHGYDLRRELQRLPVDASTLIIDEQRLTPTYTKPLRPDEAGGWVELNRLDVRSREALSPATCERVRVAVERVFLEADGCIVLDQVNETDCGVVNRAIRDFLGELASAHPDKLLFVDSRTHLGDFSFGVLKGNLAELKAAARVESDDVDQALDALASRTGRPVYCTQGERGMIVARPGAGTEHVAGHSIDGPIDIVGAGDAATSGIVTALLSDADEVEAAAIGNLAAAITVQQLGTTGTASPEQMLAFFRSRSSAPS